MAGMTTSTIRVGIHGAGGRMGRALIEAAQNAGLRLTAAVERADSPLLGQDAGHVAGLGPLGVGVTSALEPNEFDVLVDFTRPEASLAALAACRQAGRAMVIGTTGFDATQRKTIEKAAKEI